MTDKIRSVLENARECHKNKKVDKEKVRLLLDEVSLPQKEVPDPYYGGTDGFENVFQMISAASQAIAKKYK